MDLCGSRTTLVDDGEAVDERGEQPEGQPHRLAMTKGLAEETEGEKWRRRKGERQTRQRNASTPHLVVRLPATATATSATITAAAAAAAVTAKHWKTVVENTTAGTLQLKELVIEGELLFLTRRSSILTKCTVAVASDDDIMCSGSCADTGMWIRVALSFSVIPVFVSH